MSGMSSISPNRTTQHVSSISVSSYCYYGQFRCNNGQCVSKYNLCNGWRDCYDGSDEWQSNCRMSSISPNRTTQYVSSISVSSYCYYGQFRCNNGQCVSKYDLCNGWRDCYDGSDEWQSNCRISSISPDTTTHYGPMSTQSASTCSYWRLFECRNGRCIMDRQVCNGHRDCQDGSDETESLCRVIVRLRGPNTYKGIGRVEIYSYYKGISGTICDDNWDIEDAHVVCRQLGYTRAVKALQGNQVPHGFGTILLDDVQCNGYESSISKCRHRPWGVHDCSHEEDAGVECLMSVPNNVTTCENKIDLGFILDGSGSVLQTDFQKMRTFIKTLTNLFEITSGKTRVSLMTFSDEASIHIPFSKQFSSKSSFDFAVDSVDSNGGGTETAVALNMAYTDMFMAKNGARGQEVRKVLIVLTDGRSNSGMTSGPAERLRNSGVVIFALGIGKNVALPELYTIASEPKEKYVLYLDNLNQHLTITKRLLLQMCNASTLLVYCDKDSMSVAFKRSYLPKQTDINKLHLRNGSCPVSYNATHVFVALTLSTSCGTICIKTDQFESYTNYFSEEKLTSNGNFGNYFFFTNFTCSFDRKNIVGSLNFLPAKQRLFIPQSDVEAMSLSMDLYKNSFYEDTYKVDEYPVHKNLSDILYIQYAVTAGSTDLTVRAMRCYATSTNKPYDTPRYVFIARGCDSDTTIRHHSNRSNRVQRFSIQPFSFLSQHQFVYIHCNLIVCRKNFTNPVCVRSSSCPKSFNLHKMSYAEDRATMYALSLGPIMYPRTPSGDSSSNVALFVSLGVVGCVAIILALALIFIYKRRCRILRHYVRAPSSEILTLDEVSYVVS